MASKSRKVSRVILPILALFSAVTFGLTGCSDSGVAGKYVNEKRPQDITELKSDGTCVITQGKGTYTGKYAVQGKVLTLTLTTGDVATGSIDGKTITDNQGELWKKQ